MAGMGNLSVLLYVFEFHMFSLFVVSVFGFKVLKWISSLLIRIGLLSRLETPCLFARVRNC